MIAHKSEKSLKLFDSYGILSGRKPIVVSMLPHGWYGIGIESSHSVSSEAMLAITTRYSFTNFLQMY